MQGQIDKVILVCKLTEQDSDSDIKVGGLSNTAPLQLHIQVPSKLTRCHHTIQKSRPSQQPPTIARPSTVMSCKTAKELNKTCACPQGKPVYLRKHLTYFQQHDLLLVSLGTSLITTSSYSPALLQNKIPFSPPYVCPFCTLENLPVGNSLIQNMLQAHPTALDVKAKPRSHVSALILFDSRPIA